MSSSYNVEPQPTAKVILKTTAGDLSLELFAKQTPLASRNFLQLCLDGYYDNTIFHRLVPEFIIQGGDPTGTGSGGQSSFDGGAPFADEFHNRLRFNRRGLLGMANSGTKNDNASQFFLTLGKAEELNGQNTMFGRIEGDTIYNLVKMGEAELVEGEDSDRPMYPTRVIGAEIVVNPFEDMVKRTQVVQSNKPSANAVKKKPKKKAGKQMLSFGVDEDDEEGPSLAKRPKFNPKLVQAGIAIEPPSRQTLATDRPKEVPIKSSEPRESSKPRPERPKAQSPVEDLPPKAKTVVEEISSSASSTPEPDDNGQATRLAKTNAQIAELKQSLKRDVPVAAEHGSKRHKTGLEYLVPAGAKRGVRRAKPGSKEEQKQLSAFTAFQAQLGGTANGSISVNMDETSKASEAQTERPHTDRDDQPVPEEEDVCDLHFVPNCQSCKRWEEAEDGERDDELTSGSLLGHSLTFAKDRLGKSLEWKRQNEKELVVIDPRQKEKEILGLKKQSKSRSDR